MSCRLESVALGGWCPGCGVLPAVWMPSAVGPGRLGTVCSVRPGCVSQGPWASLLCFSLLLDTCLHCSLRETFWRSV